jgi:anaphase-promoting complex subunit 4
VQVIQIVLSIENGISTVHSIESSAVQLGNGEAIHVKFSDQNILLILWRSNGESNYHEHKVFSHSNLGTTHLLNIPYRSNHNGKYCMEYSQHNTQAGFSRPTVLENDEVTALFSHYQIPDDDSFVPETMEVRELKGRGKNEDKKRIVLLGKDGLQYKVFGFPTLENRATREDEDISM